MKSQKNKAPSKGAKKKKTSLLQKIRVKLSFRMAALLLITFSTFCIGGILTFLSYNFLFEHKLADSVAIMYLELERNGEALSHDIRQKISYHIEKRTIPSYIIRIGDTTTVKHGSLNRSTIKKIDAEIREKKSKYFIVSIKGLPHIGHRSNTNSGILVSFWRYNLNHWFYKSKAHKSLATIYIANKSGQLLYSNSKRVKQKGFLNRQIVQKFIFQPTRRGLVEYDVANAGSYYGFYSILPETTLAVFSEVDAWSIIEPILSLIGRFFLISCAVTLFIALLIQIPLSSLTQPLSNLVRAIEMLKKGHYVMTPKNSGFGELFHLGSSFNNMVVSMREQNILIKKHIKDLEKKARMEEELNIAKQVQNNFLVNLEDGYNKIFDISTSYSPAGEVAGDWYGLHFNPTTKELVACIVDVAGHGAGSCIFTGIIASDFSRFRTKDSAAFDYAKFILDANSSIHRLGKNAWHATMQIMCYTLGKDEFTMINCGHNFASHITSKKTKSVVISSTPLGIEAEYTVKKKVVKVTKGDYVLMYTDGLIENPNLQGEDFGKVRLRNFFKSTPKDLRTAEFITRLEEKRNKHVGKAPADDDVCIICFRIPNYDENSLPEISDISLPASHADATV